MANEDKPNVGLLIAMKAKEKMKGKSGEDDGAMYEDMAGELFDAMSKKDKKMFGKHLKDFIKTCLHKNS